MVVEARVGLVGGEGAPVAADRYPSLQVGKAAQGRADARMLVAVAAPRGRGDRPVATRAVILRCTKKVRDLLGKKPDPLDDLSEAESEWYVNLIWIDKRKNLLIVEAETLFAIFVADVRKADISPFEVFITERIGSELLSEGLPPQLFGSLDPSGVRLAPTASKSVLGTMNVTSMYIHHATFQEGGLRFCDAAELSRGLRRLLHRGPDYIVPIEVARARAASRSRLN